jgi:hypothetical protein
VIANGRVCKISHNLKTNNPQKGEEGEIIRLPWRGQFGRAAAARALCACVQPAALLAMPRTALARQCVSKARYWRGHVDR